MRYKPRFIQKNARRYMVYAINLVAVLLFAATSAQGLQSATHPAGADKLSITSKITTPGPMAHKGQKTRDDADFRAAARKMEIATRRTTAFKTLFNGYYLVAGVFGNDKNAVDFTTRLKGRGLDARTARNPENGMHYIYLSYSPDWVSILSLASSGVNGKYKDKIWVMDVREGRELAELTGAKANPERVSQDKTDGSTSFKEAALKHGIATRSSSAFPTANHGFHIIAGVFGSKANALTYSKKLNPGKLKPEILYNPATQRSFVSIGHYTAWEDAIRNSVTGMNGLYDGDVWILEVQGLQSHAKTDASHERAVFPFPEVARTSSGKPSNGHSHKDPPEIAKLLEKADAYFHKMWYAEAAELYEMVLDKTEDPSADIIQKAGDSHYFNTNMERAYYWYNRLYNRFRNDMSAENLFKYAHTLKGTGRYGRAKRLMRLYNKKMENTPVGPPAGSKPAPSEVVLDNILQKEQLVEIKNLAINSKYSEFAPMFLDDDKVVFASSADSAFFHTRRYKWNNQPYLDLYVAKMNEESQEVRDAVKFSKKVNSKYHEAAVTFSPDNQTMYFTRNNFDKKLRRDKKGVNNLKIYKSEKVGGEWTEAVELPFNSDDYSTGHPALSPDGKQLYFVSDMPGSLGETDIFVVDVLGDGTFSEPRNLGPEINTRHKEMFPFINDSKLYFSSDGHTGLGGLDIYEVAFDESDGFLEVRNLGRPVNSNMDDFSYIVNEDTQKGYFASNRKGGKGDDDIYSFHKLFPEEVNKNAIAGVVTDLVTGETMPEALVTLLDEHNMKLKEMVTGDDGAFVFEDLEGSTKYTIKTTRSEYFKSELPVVTLENEKVALDVALKRLDERIVVEAGITKLKTDMIYFDFDKSYIRKDAAAELDELLEVMNEYSSMVIRIESHTDSRGPAAYNKYLSDQRAKATRAYLIKNGISPDRIESAIGYGEERLLNGCNGSIRCTSEQHQLNRRSEFIIVHM